MNAAPHLRLWIGGEFEAALGEIFRPARGSVEDAVNSVLARTARDIPLEGWDVIAIIRRDDGFDEIVRFSDKMRDMDFRLRVPFDEFSTTDARGRQAMIFAMLERSLDLLQEKGLESVHVAHLRTDLATARESLLSG